MPGRSRLRLRSEESCPTSSARQGNKDPAILLPSQPWHPRRLPLRDTPSSGSGRNTGGLASFWQPSSISSFVRPERFRSSRRSRGRSRFTERRSRSCAVSAHERRPNRSRHGARVAMLGAAFSWPTGSSGQLKAGRARWRRYAKIHSTSRSGSAASVGETIVRPSCATTPVRDWPRHVRASIRRPGGGSSSPPGCPSGLFFRRAAPAARDGSLRLGKRFRGLHWSGLRRGPGHRDPQRSGR